MEEIYIHVRFLLLNTQKKHRMVSECSVFLRRTTPQLKSLNAKSKVYSLN